MKISSADRERMIYINFLMRSIHECTTDIYENLTDREFNEVKTAIVMLIEILKDLEESVDDELQSRNSSEVKRE